MALFSFLKFRKKGALEQKGPASRRQQRKDETTQLRRKPARGIGLITVICVLVIWAACCFSIIWRPRSGLDVIEGQKAPQNLFAEISFTAPDEKATQEARRAARDAVPEIYSVDKDVWQTRKTRFDEFFGYLEHVQSNGPKPDLGENDAKWGVIPQLLSPKQAKTLASGLGSDLVAKIKENLVELSNSNDQESWLPVLAEPDYNRVKLSQRRITYVRNAKQDARQHSRDLKDLATPTQFVERLLLSSKPKKKWDERVFNLAVSKLRELVVPDMVLDSQLTREQRRQAAEAVKPITIAVRKNELILKQGNVIRREDMVKKNAYEDELKNREEGLDSLLMDKAPKTSWCFWITLCWMFILFHLQPKAVRKRTNVLLISLIVTINILLLWGTNHFVLTVLSQPPRYVFPALPLAFTAITLSILMRPRIGLLAGLLVVLLQAAITGEEASFLLVLGSVSTVAGALSVRSVRTRLQTSRAALYTPPCVILVLTIYFLTRQMYQWQSFAWAVAIAIGSIILTLFLVNLVLPICEYIFGITTDISLLELSDLNHPLLKRLSLEAPGTYAHTMMVATIAEHAAEAIGANTLLARVASYFHDIGKLSNPPYFTENSLGNNMHEDLSPKMSARIILNHVKEGLSMASKFKLKAPIREAIATHHGNGLVYYFYHRAKEENKLADSGGEHEYRYPGPNPRSPEATIISLADACEAASRSLEKPTPQKIDSLINDIFKGKLFGGQLDESELTMQELLIVRENIKKNLRVMLHGRIAYPKNEEVESKVQKAGFAEKSREIERSRLIDMREKEQTSTMRNIRERIENGDAEAKEAVAVEENEEGEPHAENSADQSSEQVPAGQSAGTDSGESSRDKPAG